MSKRLLLLNLVLVTAAVVFSIQLVRTFLAHSPLPSSSPTRATQAAPAATTEGGARALAPLAQYDVVASKNLFTPTRSETATASIVPTAKPFLYGVVFEDGSPAAFLEDPTTKRVARYKTGDSIAGGQVERIEPDRVVIRRAEGTFEVLLRDPQKPQAAAAVPPAVPGQAAVPGLQPPPPGPTPQVQVPQAGTGLPGAPPPMLFRRPQAPAAPPVRNP